MKKSISILLVLILLLAVSVTAFADPISMCTQYDDVIIYAMPDIASGIVKKLPKGTEVQVTEMREGWCTVPEGYIRADDLGTHTFGDWVVTKAPTCTAYGERIHSCTNCAWAETQLIDKAPHTFGDWIVSRESTCTMEGQAYHICKVCGYQEYIVLEKKPHRFGDWVVTLEATDHSAGEQTRACVDCGFAQFRSFDPEGTLRRGAYNEAVREIQQLLADQDYLKSRDVDGSFGSKTEAAIKAFQTSVGVNADGVAWPQTIRLLHHSFGDWELVAPLTRVNAGELARVCSECGYTEHKILPLVPTFKLSDCNNGIKSVQNMLNALGFKCGEADGAYGKMLEKAWKNFALENGIDPVAERLRPADLDALTNAWLGSLPEADQSDNAAKLVLTVTPAGEENCLQSYNWTLTNLGSEKARFVTLLLGCGEGHDFREDNLVMVIDYARLKADGENQLSGSFTISSDWAAEEGAFSFCAIATADKTGAVLSSNVVSFDVEAK